MATKPYAHDLIYPGRDWIRPAGTPVVIVPLTLRDGSVTWVDREDYAWLSAWTWYRARNRAVVGHPHTPRTTFLHRLILNAQPGQIVDHIDGDPRNNTRANLRFATQSQNRANEHVSRGGSSVYRGVYWDANREKWSASLAIKAKPRFLGRFTDEAQAARAYDRAAAEYFGEFATLNFPNEVKR
jgi:hypothetical protein